MPMHDPKRVRPLYAKRHPFRDSSEAFEKSEVGGRGNRLSGVDGGQYIDFFGEAYYANGVPYESTVA